MKTVLLKGSTVISLLVITGNVLISDEGGTVLMDFGSVVQGRCRISSRKEALAMQVSTPK